MGDLFFHLGFARRLRHADGLHPIVVEAMVRQARSMAVGALLPLLPGLERPKISWWQKMFFGATDPDDAWIERLRGARAQTGALPMALLTAEPAGPMMRFALALGAISYEVSSKVLEGINDDVDAANRSAVERAQTRLWLQSAIANHKAFASEWTPAVITHDDTHTRRLIDHIDESLRKAHGEAAGADNLRRWLKAMSDRVSSARGELPAAGIVPDHSAREAHFDKKDFVAKVQDGVDWFVALAEQLSPRYVGGEPTGPDIEEILLAGGELRRPEAVDLGRSKQRAKMDINALRAEHLARGRNDTPAFDETSLSEMEQLQAVLPDLPPVADPGATGAPPAPTEDDESRAFTTQISADDVAAAEQTEPVPAAPAVTQAVSVAQIEAEMAASNDAEPIPEAPAHTQQVAVADIESEVNRASSDGGFPTPANTQQVSVSDIEEEMAAQAGAVEERPKTPPLGTPRNPTPPLGTPVVDEAAAEEPAEETADVAANGNGEAASDDEDDEESTQRFPVPPSSTEIQKSEPEVEETMRFPVPPAGDD